MLMNPRFVLAILFNLGLAATGSAFPTPGQPAPEAAAAAAPPLIARVIQHKADPRLIVPREANRKLYKCGYPVRGVTLDGEFREPFWQKVPWVFVEVEGRREHPADSQDDASYFFAAVADEGYLYVAFKVYDDIRVVEDRNFFQETDGVEIFLSGSQSPSNRYGPADVQIAVRRDGKVRFGRNTKATGVERIITAVAETFYGWNLEVSIPLDLARVQLRDGLLIGFNTHGNDNDDDPTNNDEESSRDHKMIWSALDLQDTSYRDPSVFGRLQFVRVDF